MTNQNANPNPNAVQNEWTKREVGALWKKEGKTQKFLAGHFDVDEFGTKKRLKVVIFSNKHKNNEKQPDFRIYLSEEAPASKTQGEARAETAAPTQSAKISPRGEHPSMRRTATGGQKTAQQDTQQSQDEELI